MSAKFISDWRSGISRITPRIPLGGEVGAALVEFTIIAPMLVWLSIYTADFGLLILKKVEVQNAAQAGAQWAIANRIYSFSEIQAAAQNATSIPSTAISVTPSQFCACTYDMSGNLNLTTFATVTTCAPGSVCNTNGVQGSYVNVMAQLTSNYTSIVPYGPLFGFSANPKLSVTATVRIQ